jgi:hypothetical protein
MLATKKRTIFADPQGEKKEDGTLYLSEYRGLGNICWTNRPEEEVLMDFFEKEKSVERDGAETIHYGSSKVVMKKTIWMLQTPEDNDYKEEIKLLQSKGALELSHHLQKCWLPEDERELQIMIDEVKALAAGQPVIGAHQKEHLFLGAMTKQDFIERTTGNNQVQKDGIFTTIFHSIGSKRSIVIPDHLQDGWNVFSEAIR